MKTIELAGTWKLQNKAGTYSVKSALPGDTHSALLAAGKIPDPYWADNELQLQRLAQEDWIFERSVEVSAAMLDEKSVFLNCDSLDTIATVFINGCKVAHTRNMFVRYRFEVKKYLRIGANTIRIELDSAERAAIVESKKFAEEIGYSKFPVQSPYRNLIRKVQCHGGWDWGPCLMVAGVYGKIYLGATSVGRIEYVTTEQKHHNGVVDVTVNCEVEAPADGKTDFTVKLDGQTLTKTVRLKKGNNVVSQIVRVKKPQLWWPNGFGKQPLYDLTVTLSGDSVCKRIGLRTIEIDNREDKHGVSMTFIVNGHPIFAKGANWIPADALPSRQSRAVIDDLLESAVQAHMNMIRVWGGGQYETDDFYELCDEKGLLLWHDMMFACALYPGTKDFLDLVRQEIRHQVKRLRDHASLALWCGNNENVGALRWFKDENMKSQRLLEYDRLNEGVVGDTIRELDPARLFWPSSPCGGPGDYSDCWHVDNRGDMHYWAVWHEGKPFENYLEIKPRFCSEFGYQSFPSLETIRTYATKDQWNLTSPIMEHHQRHPRGNSLITENFTRYFRVPEGFENSVYLSQLQQGLAIRMAVEHWRHLRPVCMGALYWQLNDLWPVCSWASLNYGGKWKPLHYMAKRFFAPQLISVHQHQDSPVEIWATNDALKPVSGAVRLRILDFSGKVLKTVKWSAKVGAAKSLRLKKFSVAELTDRPTETFLSVEWKVGGETLRNVHFFTAYKKCDLQKSRLDIKVKAEKKGFRVTLKAKTPAFWVDLNADEIAGEFDDNCFSVLPGEARSVFFTPKHEVTLEKFRKQLTTRHLRETYL